MFEGQWPSHAIQEYLILWLRETGENCVPVMYLLEAYWSEYEESSTLCTIGCRGINESEARQLRTNMTLAKLSLAIDSQLTSEAVHWISVSTELANTVYLRNGSPCF